MTPGSLGGRGRGRSGRGRGNSGHRRDRSRSGASRSGIRRYVPADPHITVFVGRMRIVEDTWDGHGHFCVRYDQMRRPYRLALGSKLQLSQNRVNPEIWDRRQRLLRTYAR